MGDVTGGNVRNGSGVLSTDDSSSGAIDARRRLTPGWFRTVLIGWCGLFVALVCVGISSHIIGRPVFWLDDQRWSIPLLIAIALAISGPPIVAAIWALAHGPWMPSVSFIATSVLLFAAFVDRHSSPGAAFVTLALGVSGMLLSASSLAGRYRFDDQ